MRMFESGNHLGFSFKAADEVGVISEGGPNNFDGDFTVDNILFGTVYGTKPTHPQ